MNGHLWESTLFFRRFWEQAKLEALRRRGKVREKIDLLMMQKAHTVAEASRPKTRPGNPFDGLGSSKDNKAEVLLEELRRCFEAECWSACGILMRILLERAIEAVEPACRAKKGLGAKLDFCIGQRTKFGQSMTDVLRHLKAAKLTGDIIAHDSTLVVEQTDVDISAPYLRHLITFWSARPAASVVAIQFSQGS